MQTIKTLGELKKTGYIARCSVKSTTIYREQFILVVHFLFKKKKIVGTTFHSVKNWLVRILFILKRKERNKKTLHCRF